MGAWLERVPVTPEQGHDARRVVFLGHLVERQGVSTLLAALAALRERGVEVSADVVGRGPLEQALRAEAAEFGLDGSVTFHGFVPRHEDVERILAAASVGLAPYEAGSFTQYADPGKLKSYLAAGLPIVTTEVPPNAQELERAGAAVLIDGSPGGSPPRSSGCSTRRRSGAPRGRRRLRTHADSTGRPSSTRRSPMSASTRERAASAVGRRTRLQPGGVDLANVDTILERIGSGLGEPFELIVVSDGSVDRTQEQLLELRDDACVSSITTATSARDTPSSSAASRHAAAGSAFVDADLDLDPAAIPRFLRRAEARSLGHRHRLEAAP